MSADDEEDDRCDMYTDKPCPKCGSMTLIEGYGLMGGGLGLYEACDKEGCGYFYKEQDQPPEAVK